MANINEVIETIKDKVAWASQTAVQKSKDTATIAKAKLAIRNEQTAVKKAERELGKLYYKDYIAKEEPDAAEYTPWCEKIDECKQTIADLKALIEDLKSRPEPEDEEELVVELTEDDLVQETGEAAGESGEEAAEEPKAE